MSTSSTVDRWTFETLDVQLDAGVLVADISAPPMNLLGPELVRDLVSLIQRAEADAACSVLVFTSADPDYFMGRARARGPAERRGLRRGGRRTIRLDQPSTAG